MTNDDKLSELIAVCNQMNQIHENRFFISLNDPTYMNVSGLMLFYQSHKHFGLAVDHWSRVLAKLVSTAKSHNERRVLLKNLSDENCQCELSHVQTFQNFLNVIKNLISNQATDNWIANDAVNSFIDAIHDVADNKQHSEEYKYAFMGMIEFTYIEVSKCIHNFVSRFVDPSMIPHYSLHEIMDVTHSTDFLSLCVPAYRSIECDRTDDIMNGIRNGYAVFYKLYDCMGNVFNA